MSAPEITATLSPRSPRRADWIGVFGSDTVPIQSPVPIRADAPGGPRYFYRVAVAALTAEQRARLVAHVAGRFGLTADQVERDLDDPAHGLPILAEDVIVAIPSRLLL